MVAQQRALNVIEDLYTEADPTYAPMATYEQGLKKQNKILANNELLMYKSIKAALKKPATPFHTSLRHPPAHTHEYAHSHTSTQIHLHA